MGVGTGVPLTPRAITGKNFIERIENWHKQQPAQATASMNIYGRDRPPHMLYMASAVDEEEEDREEVPGIMAYQEAGDASLADLSVKEIEAFLETRKKAEKAKGKEKFDGVYLPPKPTSAPKKKATFTPAEVAGPAGKLPQIPIPPPPQPGPPKPFVPKYRAAIEESINTSAMVDRALDNKFLISARNLS
ncbi:hypothetical protein B0H19DRAFT_1255829 [Mycena capillaripes]|nr:hypothetical protein B0H19DRAFT_1255829 [Mycena capillaripes]